MMVRDNWQLFSGAIDANICNDITEHLLKIEPEEATTFNNNIDVRISKVRWVTQEAFIENLILTYVNKANANSFNVDIQQDVSEIQFTEYKGEDKAKYDWHHDVNWENPKNHDRKLSVVIQLSDPENYVGGNFEFAECEDPQQKALKRQGSVLVFPSYLTHRVMRVTEGTRYSLVSWIQGPRWR